MTRGMATCSLAALLATPAVAQPAAAGDAAAIARLDAENAALRAQINMLEARLQRLEQPASVGAPAPAGAAEAAPEASEQPPERAPAPAPALLNIPPSPADRSGGGGEVDRRSANVQLLGGTGDGEVTIQLRSLTSRAEPTRDGGVGIRREVALIASAPTSESGDSPIASVDGLSNGARLKFAFTRFEEPFVDPSSQPSESRLGVLNQRRIAECIRRISQDDPKRAEKIQSCQDRNNPSDRKAYLLPAEFLEYEALLAGAAGTPSWSVGAEASIGYSSMNWLNQLTDDAGTITGVRAQTLKRFDWDVRGTVGLFPGRGTALFGSVQFARGFEEQDEGTLCPVIADAALLSCRTGPIGRPERQDSLAPGIEWRQLIRLSDDGLIQEMAIAPKLTTNLLRAGWAVDAPISFVPDSNGRLIGGVRLGFESRRNAGGRMQDDFKAGIFVGTAFTLR